MSIKDWFRRPREPEVPERANMPWGPRSQMAAALGGGTYNNVNVSTVEGSLQSIAVRSSVDLLASLMSELPVHVYSGSGSARALQPIPDTLADPAGDGNGHEDWRYQVAVSWLTRGNAYGFIEQQFPNGQLGQVVLQHPDEVTGELISGKPTWFVAGQKVDEPRRFLHSRVNPMPGRIQGLSPVQFHAEQIGLSLTSQAFGLQWFRDGAHPSSLLTNSEAELNEDEARSIKERYMATLYGTREPLVYGRGWEYKAIQVSAEESQFLATQGYSEAQCARIFGPGMAEVLGYESGGNLTYANVESRSAHLLIYSAGKWFNRMDRLLSRFCPEGLYARIDRDAMLQSTTMERYKVHGEAVTRFWKTINEIRSDEDLPPVEWGDEPYFNQRSLAVSEATSVNKSMSTSKSFSQVIDPNATVDTGQADDGKEEPVPTLNMDKGA